MIIIMITIIVIGAEDHPAGPAAPLPLDEPGAGGAALRRREAPRGQGRQGHEAAHRHAAAPPAHQPPEEEGAARRH